MNAVSINLNSPYTYVKAYVERKDKYYRIPRLCRSAFRWAVQCQDIMGFSEKTVSVLMGASKAVATTSLCFLVPRVVKTAQKIWGGGVYEENESSYMDYVYIIGDISKISMTILRKTPIAQLLANSTGLYIYGKRLVQLVDKYFSSDRREANEDDNLIFIETVRVVVCMVSSFFHFAAALFGFAFLSEITFLTLVTINQFLHFGSCSYWLSHTAEVLAQKSDNPEEISDLTPPR